MFHTMNRNSITDVYRERKSVQARFAELCEKAGPNGVTSAANDPKSELYLLKDRLQKLDAQIDDHNANHGLSWSAPGIEDSGSLVQQKMSALDTFYRHGTISASDVPLHIQESPVDTSLAASVPAEVSEAIINLNDLDPFAAAGAQMLQRNTTGPLTTPIFYGAPAATVKAEGTSATESAVPSITHWTLEGSRYVNLTKVSLESLMNVAFDLGRAVTRTLIVGQIQSQVADITEGFQAALQGNAAHCLVSNGADSYEALVNLLTSISPTFAGSNNRFMLSRADLAYLLNVRFDSKPILDPTGRTILGVPYVINDSLTRVLYGNFGSAMVIARTGLFVRRLEELYAEEGHVGFQAFQWMDSKYYASLSPTDQPVKYVDLHGEGS